MENILETIPVNISTKLDIMEIVYIGANCSPEEISIYISLFKELCYVFGWSYKEMSGIDPSIVEHEIRMYLNVKHVQKKRHPVNLRKAETVKDEAEKMFKDSFIYSIYLI